MSSGVLLLLFLAEFLVLFLFSRAIPKALSQIFYNLTHSHKAMIHLMALTFLPGTIIHELSHALSAGLMLVHVGDVEFLPEVHEDGVKLGSAQIGQTDPIRRALIGVAPIIIGIALIITILSILDNFQIPWWGFVIAAWLVFEIANTMFSSKRDLEGFWKFAILIFAILAGFYIVGFQQFFSVTGNFFQSEGMLNFLKNATFLLLIPIILDLAIYVLAKMILKR